MIQENIQEVSNYLKTIEDKIDDNKAVMNTIGEKIVTKTMEAFEKERDPISGTPWSPISSNSLFAQTGGKKNSKIKSGKRHTKAFMKKAADKKLLRDQGQKGGLMGSIDYKADKDSVTIHAGKEYAATHFFGDSKRNIKQRRYMPFDDKLDISKDLADEIIEDLDDHIFGDEFH